MTSSNMFRSIIVLRLRSGLGSQTIFKLRVLRVLNFHFVRSSALDRAQCFVKYRRAPTFLSHLLYSQQPFTRLFIFTHLKHRIGTIVLSLWLSLVVAFNDQSLSFVWVQSKPVAGASFALFLPNLSLFSMNIEET